jgi:beta-glucanase (GH16 family)
VGDTIQCPDHTYKLVFEDNFDGTGLDLNNWQTYYPWGRSLHSPFTGTGWERQYYKDENVSVHDGYLQLTTIVEPGLRSPEPASSNVFFNFTSGMVFSVMNFGKGKFEARCKIPKIVGMFPAFWLYGYCSQEIDIFEFTNSGKSSEPATDGSHVIMTYHRQNNCSDTSKGSCSSGFSRKYPQDMSDDFHIYSVEWNESKIVWKIDNEIAREVYRFWEITSPDKENAVFGYASPVKSCEFFNANRQYSEFYPFPSIDNTFHVIINSAVSFERAGDLGALPQEFLIDYVRAYEEIDSPEHIIEKSLSDFIVSPNPTDGIAGIPSKIIGQPIDQIEIKNALGFTVKCPIQLNGDHYSINFLQQAPGLYFILIKTNGRNLHKKVIYR